MLWLGSFDRNASNNIQNESNFQGQLSTWGQIFKLLQFDSYLTGMIRVTFKINLIDF